MRLAGTVYKQVAMARLQPILTTLKPPNKCPPSTSTIPSLTMSQLSSMCMSTSSTGITPDRLSDILSYSNLMVDTFIANADPEEYGSFLFVHRSTCSFGLTPFRH